MDKKQKIKIIIAGSYGTGKTTLAQIILNALVEKNIKVDIVDIDEVKEMLVSKTLEKRIESLSKTDMIVEIKIQNLSTHL